MAVAESYSFVGILYDNREREVVPEIRDELKGPGVYALHRGKAYNGYVYKDRDGRWHEEVRVYGQKLPCLVEGDSLPQLLKRVKDRFGWE